MQKEQQQDDTEQQTERDTDASGIKLELYSLE
jgi:hypothetical protein